jgi:hypothetical protein
MRIAPFILAGVFASSLYAGTAAAQAGKTDQTSKAQRAAPADQRSTKTTCPSATPLACPGTDSCCPADTPNLCRSLRRAHPAGIAPVGWSGCVRPASNESWKFWSDSCQPIWEQCR